MAASNYQCIKPKEWKEIKVDRPDYKRYLVLPVEERTGLWKLFKESPSSFEEKLLSLIDAAVELDDALEELRGSL